MAQKQKQVNNHFVTIKGTKEGLILNLDDNCSFDHLLSELETKLIHPSENQPSDGPKIPVKVKVGKRYLTEQQEELLHKIIYQKKNLLVDAIESEVITKEYAEYMKKENEITSVSRMVRSGQILKVQGDLLLIGDVNPGGYIAATGNIFVMGSLKGIAHAGCEGRTSAIVSASIMIPSLVRIADQLFQDEEDEQEYDGVCAYLDDEDNQIKMDRLHILHQIRPGLNRL
ncbi:septum site-determining protein MinC [Pseudalkalibacillus berkeleyi]|uniref:Probable septum site-determining protein MinC n=1 Tax=Pseudalkalibacillus berkeleyi TaxID=1069813 RepID=A0ABS9GZC7_9BACL|nr:septum site-determining protein MinC [Pseudalkalibacillus berkeleyi]MCF6138094.1 septum site-determining protein MinC [Pseudalkalibacillus berkeleyi]